MVAWWVLLWPRISRVQGPIPTSSFCVWSYLNMPRFKRFLHSTLALFFFFYVLAPQYLHFLLQRAFVLNLFGPHIYA